MSKTTIEAYPLHWPFDVQRTASPMRARFKNNTFGRTRDNVMRQLGKMNAEDIIISSNLPIRNDGLPYARTGRIDDHGIAVYFMRNNTQMVIACDTYTTIEDNIHAIAKTLEALRGIERWGASDFLNRAFLGFKALPAASPWWEILEVSRTASFDQVQSNYRRLVKEHHPDRGGNRDTFESINRAWVEYQKL